MKKNLIKIVIGSLTAVIIVITILLVLLRPAPLMIGYIPKQYSLLNNQDTWPLYLYANQKNSYYFKKENITNAYLKSTNDEYLYKVHINGITTSNTKYKINEKKYYLYQFDFKLPFQVDMLETITNAYLSLEFGEILINVYLGNFASLSTNDTLNIRITSQKGIVNEVIKGNSTFETLTGMIITVTSEENMTLNLKKIECISDIISTNFIDVKVLSTSEYHNTQPIDDILSEGTDVVPLKANEKMVLAIKFNYQQLLYVDNLSLVLHFDEGVKTIPGVQLFKTTLNDANIVFQAYDFY